MPVSYRRAILPNAVRSAISGRARAKTGVETGGILIGHTVESGALAITGASGAGPNARHARRRFSRDTAWAQRWLDRRYHRSDNRDDYIGEWHVHSSLNAPPSPTDRHSLWKIALSRRYKTATPILLIVEHEPHADIVFRVYAFSANPCRCDELDVIREQ